MQGTNTASAPLLSPAAERQRLESLRRYRILDTLPEAAYDDIVRLARQVCGTPQAVMTFVAEDRQWFKAAEGIEGEETERGIAFCDVAIRRPGDVTVVNDASQHPIFRHYPQVTGPDHLRFYAGAPMVTPEGHALGTVCVVDTVPGNSTRNSSRPCGPWQGWPCNCSSFAAATWSRSANWPNVN